MSEAMSDRSSFHEWQRNYYKGLVQRGVERGLFAEVPWCAEHNAEYSERLGKCWVYRGSPTTCRLEEPARHYVVKEAE